MSIKLRNGRWQLYRRVPKRYASVEPRTFVWASLHTDSRSVAEAKEPIVWQQMLDGWEAKLKGETSDAEALFDAARDLAQSRGFRYLGTRDVARLPTEDLLKRVEAISNRKGEPDPGEARAFLGRAAEPGLTIGRALESYWSLAKDQTLGKSEDQLRRWRNPRIKAVKNLIAVVGNKPLAELTRDDMLAFRDWWTERLEVEDLTPNSANKDFIHLGDVLKTVVQMKRLSVVLPLGGLSFKEGDAKTRPPFSTDWIRNRLLADGALAGLNVEARCILLGMVNTGARPSELAALTPECIRLDQKVPHISIEPIGCQLKTRTSRRVIPLTGVSLEAVRQMPAGFPRYRANPASLSATVNSFLRENGLMETPDHSLYSLRHAFEDRMLAAGVDERIRRDLMGHTLGRERYGAGASLEHLQSVVQAAAL